MNKIDKLLAILAHASVWFSCIFVAFGVPAAILLLCDNPTVKANAREAVNVQLTQLVWLLIWIGFFVVCIAAPSLFGAGMFFIDFGRIMEICSSCITNTSGPDPTEISLFITQFVDRIWKSSFLLVILEVSAIAVLMISSFLATLYGVLMPLVAIVSVANDGNRVYKYPLIIHFFRNPHTPQLSLSP